MFTREVDLMTPNVLVIEDDLNSQDALRMALGRAGWPVTVVATGEAGLAKIQTEDYAVVLVDVTLEGGGINGFETCRRIREQYPNLVIIFVTASDSIGARLTGLGFKPNDYITKPFDPVELVMRIENQLSLTKSLVERWVRVGAKEVSHITGDISEGGVKRGRLTETERRVFQYLYRNHHRICSKNELMDAAWGVNSSRGNVNSLEQVISSLREQLGHQYIQTRYGAGYQLRLQPRAGAEQ